MNNAYEAIGLRRNPFVAESTVGVEPELWIDRGHSDAPAPSSGLFVQFLGPKGAGKTSHLLWWRRQTPGPYRHLPPSWRRAQRLPVDGIAYWDEADRSPAPVLWWAIRRAARAGSTVVVGTHVDLAPAARRAGFAVRTIDLAPLSGDEVVAFAHRRIEAVVGHGPGVPMLSSDEAATVAERADRSWRRAADLLHVWAAGLVAEATR